MIIYNIRKLIKISWITLAISALIIGGMLLREKHEHKVDLDETRLQNEVLLSEKLALDKEIMHYVDAMNSLKWKNEQTDKLLAKKQRKLTDSETAYSKILRENAQTKNLKKQLAESNKMKDDLSEKLNDLTLGNSYLVDENFRFESSLFTTQSEKDELMKQIDAAITASLIKPDNYLIETHRHVKRDRLTYNAKRTRKLTVVLDMPAGHSAGISFNIITPDGKVITEKNKMLTWKYLNNDKNLTASIKPFDDELQVSSQVILTYTPITKMKPGEYKIAVMKNDQNIGNCRVKLK